MRKEVFINNRKRLYQTLEDNSLVILFAGQAPKKSADQSYIFTPNRNFYYMTGIDEPIHVMGLSKINDNINEKLFVKKPDPEMEKWYGKTIRKDEATKVSGIDDIEYLEDFENVIHSLIVTSKVENIYLDLERDSFEERTTLTESFAKKIIRKYPYIKVKNIYDSICNLRLVKCEEEIQEIRKAIDITIGGVEMMMKKATPKMKENELEAYFDFVYKTKGAKDVAFKNIVASGVNGSILHYVDNNCEIKDNELVLFDVGAQLNYYNGDISRTIPANGKFTERQKEVYNAVLYVNETIIKDIKPGANWGDLNQKANDLLAEKMIELGLITDKKDYRKYYWHSIGHSLGLDDHDVGPRWIDLKPGMVVTVEPGLYIEEECIGIRIEDDILVTKNGNENLTKNIVKSIEDIEEFMKK